MGSSKQEVREKTMGDESRARTMRDETEVDCGCVLVKRIFATIGGGEKESESPSLHLEEMLVQTV